MLSKLAILLAASMATLVAAGSSDGPCKTGPVQCCNTLYKSDSAEWNLIKELAGISIPVDAMIGAQCSPISLVGVEGGSHCSSQPVCCEHNGFNGVVAAGCSPINIF